MKLITLCLICINKVVTKAIVALFIEFLLKYSYPHPKLPQKVKFLK